jgi:hypothetical protein
MSIQQAIRQHVDDEKLFQVTSLDLEIWGVGEDEVARTMYVSPGIEAALTPPFADTIEGQRMGEFRAWMESFILGGELTVAEDPDNKPRETMLARVHHVDDQFWAIRVTEPAETPGVRAFGAFSDLDEFVALTWENREIIDDQFNEEVDAAIDAWMDLFNSELPHRGNNIHEYLTICTPV